MAETIQDLLVRVSPEGVSETTEELEQQSEQFEETADAAEEQTGKLEAFSERWTGAMGAVAAGVAVAAGALTSKVPVLGSTISGIDALMTSLGLTLDQFLRDLGVTGNLFFDLAQSVDRLQGPAEDAAGAITGLGTALGGIVAIAGGGSLASAVGLGNFGVSLSSVAAAASSLGSAIAGSTAAIAGMSVAIGGLIGGLGVWTLKTTGVLNSIQNLGSGIRSWIGGPAADFLLTIGTITSAGGLPAIVAAGEFVKGFLEGGFDRGIQRAKNSLSVFDTAIDGTVDTVTAWGQSLIDEAQQVFDDFSAAIINNGSKLKDAIVTVSNDAAEGLSDLSSDAIQWGRDTITNISQGIKEKAGNARNEINAIRTFIEEQLNPNTFTFNPFDWGRDLMDEIASGIETAGSKVEGAIEEVRGFIDDNLSFDIMANDRMAARWGADLVQHFSAGMAAETGSLSDPTIELPDVSTGDGGGHAFAGRGRPIETVVELDGREIARAVGDDQSGGVNSRGRF